MRDVELVIVDPVHEHVDARQVEGGQVNLLTEEPFGDVFLPEHFCELEKQRTGSDSRVAQPVTMDTRPWCGVVLSDSAETGYELGIRTVAVVWRLGCLTVECPARRYPGCLP